MVPVLLDLRRKHRTRIALGVDSSRILRVDDIPVSLGTGQYTGTEVLELADTLVDSLRMALAELAVDIRNNKVKHKGHSSPVSFEMDVQDSSILPVAYSWVAQSVVAVVEMEAAVEILGARDHKLVDRFDVDVACSLADSLVRPRNHCLKRHGSSALSLKTQHLNECGCLG